MNSKFARKQSTSTYSQSKRTKFTATPDAEVQPMDVYIMPQGESTLSPDITSDAIPAGDWLTAICQSLGDDPALVESPLVVDLDAETTTMQPCMESHAQPGTSAQVLTTSSSTTGSRIEPQPPRPRKESKTLQEWLVNDCLVISLRQTDYKLHIHLQKCTFVDRTITMDNMTVLMNIPTYVDFKEKMKHVDIIYETSSVICNNQLAIFSRRGELIMHQIFFNREFQLKQAPLKIDYLTLLKISDITYDIDRAIENALVCDVLPEKILEKADILTIYFPDLMEEFVQTLQQEVSRNVPKLYKCDGCKISDPSQSNHNCMTVNYRDQLAYVGVNAFLMSNVNRIINDLRSKGILNCFRKEFFNNLCFSDVEPYIMKPLEC